MINLHQHERWSGDLRKLVVGILAHVDAGKTTLSEALLYQSGALRRLGRVDHQDAFLDTDAMERERGITIFSKQAVFSLKDTEVTLTSPLRRSGRFRCWTVPFWSSAALTGSRPTPAPSGGCWSGITFPPFFL